MFCSYCNHHPKISYLLLPTEVNGSHMWEKVNKWIWETLLGELKPVLCPYWFCHWESSLSLGMGYRSYTSMGIDPFGEDSLSPFFHCFRPMSPPPGGPAQLPGCSITSSGSQAAVAACPAYLPGCGRAMPGASPGLHQWWHSQHGSWAVWQLQGPVQNPKFCSCHQWTQWGALGCAAAITTGSSMAPQAVQPPLLLDPVWSPVLCSHHLTQCGTLGYTAAAGPSMAPGWHHFQRCVCSLHLHLSC